MSVDIGLIKQRKSQYGSNFECIAKKWFCTQKKVAEMMAEMKQCRIDAIEEKLKNEVFKTKDKDINYITSLQKSLYDSVTDRDNYLWIADNWSEYEKF